jgi:hypothetical protein
MQTIEVKDIGGKPHVKVKDLYANPKNQEIYDQSAIEEMALDFERRSKKGLVPNLQPVTYWPCGMTDLGHTRVGSAEYNGTEWIWALPSDAPMPDGSEPYNEVMHTLSGNIVRKKNWTVKLGEWQAAKDAYRQQFGLDMPNSVEGPLVDSIGTTKKTLQRIAEIKINAPELMEVIDNGGGVEHNWKLATGQLATKIIPAKTGGLELSTLFKNTKTRSRVISVATKYAKDMRDMRMKFTDFNVSPFEHDQCGRWESGAFTTFLSHTFMSAMAGVLKEMGYDVKTASGHKDDPDVYIIDEDEKIEVKCTQFNGHGAATKWSGGANIRNGKYLLIAHDLDFTSMFVAFTDLDSLDWGNPDIHGKKTMKLSTWFENHKDDAEIWKGNAQLVKTNKMKDGQVKMSLAPINEPI